MTLNCNLNLETYENTECVGNALIKLGTNTDTISATLLDHCEAINVIDARSLSTYSNYISAVNGTAAGPTFTPAAWVAGNELNIVFPYYKQKALTAGGANDTNQGLNHNAADTAQRIFHNAEIPAGNTNSHIGTYSAGNGVYYTETADSTWSAFCSLWVRENPLASGTRDDADLFTVTLFASGENGVLLSTDSKIWGSRAQDADGNFGLNFHMVIDDVYLTGEAVFFTNLQLNPVTPDGSDSKYQVTSHTKQVWKHTSN